MALRAEKREHRAPRERTAEEGSFYPNEVVRILGLQRVDYRQLRRLFKLVRLASGAAACPGRWARFSFQDIAALRVAINLAGGVTALRKGHRLQLKPIEVACRQLREQYDLTSPLTQARLRRDGRKVVAELGGLHFIPQSGQLVFGSLRGDIRRHVADHDGAASREVMIGHLEVEETQLREVRVQRAENCTRPRVTRPVKVRVA